MEIVNLTPHPVTFRFRRPDVPDITIPPSGTIARLEVEEAYVGTICAPEGTPHDPIDGDPPIDILTQTFGALTGLPDPETGTVFVASMLAAKAAREAGRFDVYAVARPVRDDEGRIVAAQALSDCGIPGPTPQYSGNGSTSGFGCAGLTSRD